MYNIENDEEIDIARRKVDAVCQLEEVAFDILLNNPGTHKKEFMSALFSNHKDLIVEAYGVNPDDIVPSLLKLWDTPYYDLSTGYEHTFKEWAEEFYTEKKVEWYKMRKNLNVD